jgi:fructokinase
MIYAGIEAGGTKFVCGIGNHEGEVLDRVVIPTREPGKTIAEVVDYFTEIKKTQDIRGVGLASFGPLDLDPTSSTYGFITSTPKRGWQYFDITGELEKALGCTIPVDTDVNAAALAEYKWGAARGKENVVYLTIGTGIGGGALVNGHLIHGLLHPEMGHVRIRADGLDVSDKGICPFHEYCLEGLASGPAMQARWSILPQEIPPDHPAWKLEAQFLAEGLTNIILILSPNIIILGGGIMSQESLFPLVRERVVNLLNGYIQHPDILENIDEYIIPPELGDNAGLLGAVALALGHSENGS